ncbi:DUF805 domain-containing protein [Leuconostoc mesenteroides]|uniref:DUF805 domain-containing protein n=1 Tax=Leuconostoc mesenteroides TaxID=1245 RepID=UPI00065E6A26|nr:DUF805 domain-containing protein [Leuconostoc mesenteroides]AKP35800.1 membrane protein [Leuconostoc mesenteroides subsp. dextranicum]MBZ1511147.1 DUF805 domain-containing protein [Leuconostoc mesenteroides]MBZ1525550.1 DUF805 domain-containing protein [Leuconostoc mesenteroides]ORI92713.1 DUF805 domain-containing protein [Leuconostoc mesenteroides subsp. mesenteroides]ORI94708.1 DUF805 domain-containing protein [Leuconostoc mesenteroides subsp. mesenteroides]
MINAYREFWTKMFSWHATATRTQYWVPLIVNYFLGGILVSILENMQGHSIEDIYTVGDLSTNLTTRIVMIIVWIATFTLKARRLHDTNRSAGWIFIDLIPIVGNIWFFILMVLPTTPESRWTLNQSNVN